MSSARLAQGRSFAQRRHLSLGRQPLLLPLLGQRHSAGAQQGPLQTVKGALDAALAQIRGRDYAAGLRARGAEPVREMAAVFDGKRVWVRVAEIVGAEGP